MGRLAGFTYQQVTRKLRRLGFEFDRHARGATKSGGILLPGVERLSPIILGTYRKGHCLQS